MIRLVPIFNSDDDTFVYDAVPNTVRFPTIVKFWLSVFRYEAVLAKDADVAFVTVPADVRAYEAVIALIAHEAEEANDAVNPSIVLIVLLLLLRNLNWPAIVLIIDAPNVVEKEAVSAYDAVIAFIAQDAVAGAPPPLPNPLAAADADMKVGLMYDAVTDVCIEL